MVNNNKNQLKKPLIGITPSYNPRENTLWHMVKEAYSHAIWDSDGIPVILTYPNSNGKVDESVGSVDAVVMIGGPDLPIEYYGGSPYNLNGELPMHQDRVNFDREVFKLCKQQGKPILAICAGIQHINVIHGGTLYEDIPTQLPNAIDHGEYNGNVSYHPVEIDYNSIIFDIFRETAVPVSSTHHQGVKKLGDNLKPVAWSSDGLIEAVESINGNTSQISEKKEIPCDKFIGVQWHPELMQDDPRQMRLFHWLVEEAKD